MFKRPSEPDQQLETNVRQTLPFLFSNHGEQIVSNQRLPGFGNAQMFVHVHDIILRIVQTEGSLKVLVAPSHTKTVWRDIEDIMIAVDPDSKFPPAPVFGSLADLGSLLESRVSLVEAALSKQRFDTTIQQTRQVVMKRLITLSPRIPTSASVGDRIFRTTLPGIARAIRFCVPRSKDSYAKQLPIANDAALEDAVRQEFVSLFKQGAQVSSNGRLPIMDFATVTFDFGSIRFRAMRDRGFVNVSVSPLHAIRHSYDLGSVLLAIQREVVIPQSAPSSILRGAGARLGPELARLNFALSETEYLSTRGRLLEIRRKFQEAWIEEWNRTHPNSLHAASSADRHGPSFNS